MWILEEGQILPYLRSHYPVFDQPGPVDIQCIGALEGEEKPREPDEGGLINYIFRVSNGKQSVIVKQGRSASRKNDKIVLPIWRNRQEYETLRLRHAIVPQYTPETYYVDWENAIFLMEDVSDLAQVRKLLCSGVMLPRLAEQVGEFVAASTFYCSEFYLEADLFRRLSARFRNSDMRSIMEDWVFLRDAPYLTHNGNPVLKQLIDRDESIRVCCYELRHKFMTRGEALIHGDLHTSNVFADEERLKVIDMEYTFAGPLCYDIGYFAASLLTQYCTACFRPFPSEGARRTFLSYLLSSLLELYYSFVEHFTEFWREDAKPIYQRSGGVCEHLARGFLPDVLGFAAVPCFPQITTSLTPEFAQLDGKARGQAHELCLVLSRYLLLERERWDTMEDAVQAIGAVTQIYLDCLE